MRIRGMGVLVVVIGILASRAEAQTSIWLQRGVNGFGGSLALGTDGTATSAGVAGGYSYQGWLDFELGLTYIDFGSGTATEGSDASLTALVLSPGVQYHPLKQSDNLPFSLGIGAQYNQFFFQSDALDAFGLEMSGWSVAGSLNVYRFFRLASRAGIIPAAGLGFAHVESSITDGNMTLDSSDNNWSIAVGIYLAYLDAADRVWGLVPSVTIPLNGDGDVAFGLSLSIVFSQPPPE